MSEHIGKSCSGNRVKESDIALGIVDKKVSITGRKCRALKIVGIDASLTSTGIAVIEVTRFEENRTYAIQKKSTGVKRLVEIRDDVKAKIADADLVTIEGYAFARPNQAHQIGELGGVLRVMLHEEGIPYIVVAPSAVKKFATGKGNAKKEAIAVAVYKRWGQEFQTNDEADAFVLAKIGHAYLCSAGTEFGLTKFQQEVIDVLRNPKETKKVKKTKQEA